MNKKRTQGGFALPIVLMVLTFVFALAAIILPKVQMHVKSSKIFANYQQCLLTADGVIETMQLALVDEPAYAFSQQPQHDDSGATYVITDTGGTKPLRTFDLRVRKGETYTYFKVEAEWDEAEVPIMHHYLVINEDYEIK